VQLLIPVITEGRELIVDTEDHVTASSSIAAVRTAARNVSLAPKGDHSFAAVTTTDTHTRAIEEHLDPRERSHERADAQMRELIS
jgi:hypothetical protein